MSRTGSLVLLPALVLLAGGCERTPSMPAPPPPVETPAPATAPSPDPSPAVFGCGLPRGVGNGRDCKRETASYLTEVNAAIDKVIEVYPQYFDLHDTRGGPTNYRIRDIRRYQDEVVYNLRTMGLCALDDGEEIGVKDSQEYSDQYDIVLSQGYIARSYVVTCRPAWDAIPPAGDDS